MVGAKRPPKRAQRDARTVILAAATIQQFKPGRRSEKSLTEHSSRDVDPARRPGVASAASAASGGGGDPPWTGGGGGGGGGFDTNLV
jgi:hypothetical protein